MNNEIEKDLQKHFGPWPDEKCWKIKDSFPIDVFAYFSWNGDYCTLSVKADSMSYDIYQHLDMNHRHQDINVSNSSYDYKTGKCGFTAGSVDDIKAWEKEYSQFVKVHYPGEKK